MIKFLLWVILLVICFPAAIAALIVYPFIWLIMLPFKLIGITVGAVFDLLGAIISLPARVIRQI